MKRLLSRLCRHKSTRCSRITTDPICPAARSASRFTMSWYLEFARIMTIASSPSPGTSDMKSSACQPHSGECGVFGSQECRHEKRLGCRTVNFPVFGPISAPLRSQRSVYRWSLEEVCSAQEQQKYRPNRRSCPRHHLTIDQ